MLGFKIKVSFSSRALKPNVRYRSKAWEHQKKVEPNKSRLRMRCTRPQWLCRMTSRSGVWNLSIQNRFALLISIQVIYSLNQTLIDWPLSRVVWPFFQFHHTHLLANFPRILKTLMITRSPLFYKFWKKLSFRTHTFYYDNTILVE